MKHFSSQDGTLLEILGIFFPESSKTTLRSWLKTGRITVDGKVQKLSSHPIIKGQLIALENKQKVVEEDVKVLYEDDHFIVIDKPEGLLTVSTAFETKKTAHAVLKRSYSQKIYVVHRLDQDTSGILLFALSEEARDCFKKVFEEHSIERAYSAIVEGHMEKEKGVWRSYLYEDAQYVVRETTDHRKGRLAITNYEVVLSTKKYSWLELSLETGRKNQIRVHCSQESHPIVGDKKYGAKTNPIKRVCLHARLLAFEHPITHKPMRFESPVPQEFYRLINPKNRN